MSQNEFSAEERYATIVRQMIAEDADVSADMDGTKKRFGMSGQLKVAGKMFAFLAKGRMIVKLPKPRVDEMDVLGQGERCVMGRGRVMKEWIVVGPGAITEWPAIAAEAKAFVSSKK
jgi:hypothetical protein